MYILFLFFFFFKETWHLGSQNNLSALNFDHYILTKCLKSKENILLFMKNLCPYLKVYRSQHLL